MEFSNRAFQPHFWASEENIWPKTGSVAQKKHQANAPDAYALIREQTAHNSITGRIGSQYISNACDIEDTIEKAPAKLLRSSNQLELHKPFEQDIIAKLSWCVRSAGEELLTSISILNNSFELFKDISNN